MRSGSTATSALFARLSVFDLKPQGRQRFESQLVSSLALASRVTGWLLATQARLGMTGEARAVLAALDDEWAMSGEIGNARAVICLADGDPDGVLAALWDVLDGTAPVIGYHTVVEAHLLAGLAYREPTNLSRPEIAAELSVSVNTVSTHVRSLYAKFGADDRSAAVRRSRELRLLAAVRS